MTVSVLGDPEALVEHFPRRGSARRDDQEAGAGGDEGAGGQLARPRSILEKLTKRIVPCATTA
jgi:hypothetical protein